jgi:hypothetical protein
MTVQNPGVCGSSLMTQQRLINSSNRKFGDAREYIEKYVSLFQE